MKRRKLSPGRSTCSTPEWSVTESIEFHQMEPHVEESLSQFHARLVEQAQKCFFQCFDCDYSYQQRMVRDRLILFVGKGIRKEMLCVNPNPSAEEILLKYEEVQQFQNNPAWKHILAYLNLADLEVFAQSHWMLESVVHRYLKNPHPMILDVETLQKYPVASHGDLYAKYGSGATNLIIVGDFWDIEECVTEYDDLDFDNILKYFTCVNDLTLIDVRISSQEVGHVEHLAHNLLKLCLIHTFISKEVQELWFASMTSLKSLHLQNSFLCPTPFHILTLENLTLIWQRLHAQFETPHLKRLTCENCWKNIEYDTVKGFAQLEHLRILGSVDWKQMEEIEALNLKTLDVHCCEISREANLILRLNDDCLLHLQEFLSAKDWMSFQETHSRLQDLRINCYEIHGYRPEDQSLYAGLGRLVANLKIFEVVNDDYYQLMPLFPNLRELEVYVSVRDELRTFMKDRFKMESMFRRLSPTLTKLFLIFANDGEIEGSLELHGLQELRNIRKFSSERLIVTNEFLEFLQWNRDHMEQLQFSMKMEGDTALHANVWTTVSQMAKLKHLDIYWEFEDATIPRIPAGSLPMLVSLKVSLDGPSGFDEFLGSLGGTQLRSLEYYGRNFDTKGVIHESTKNLQSLRLYPFLFWGNLIPEIFMLTKLREFRLTFIPDSNVLPLIQGLPNLISLISFREHISTGNVHQSKSLLEEKQPKMLSNIKPN